MKKILEENGYIVLESSFFKKLKKNLKDNIKFALNEILIRKRIKIVQNKNFDKFLEQVYKLEKRKKIEIFKSLYEVAPSLPNIFKLSSDYNFIKIAKKTGIKIPVIGTGCTLRIDRPKDYRRLTSVHQDQWYSFLSLNAITIWFNLSSIKKKDGPLKVYEKSHKYGLLKFKDINMGTFKASIKKTLKLNIKEIILKENQVLVFNQHLLHESGLNKSLNKPRISLQIRFNDFKNISNLTSSFKFTSSNYVIKKQLQYKIQ